MTAKVKKRKSTKSKAKAMPRAKTPKATGRPRVQVDEKILDVMIRVGCTVEEIAAELKVSKATLERRFAPLIKRGRLAGLTSLKRAQWKVALGGNPTMLIWLGKQHLGQKDVARQEHTDGEGEPLTNLVVEIVRHDKAKKKK